MDQRFVLSFRHQHFAHRYGGHDGYSESFDFVGIIAL